MAKETKRISWEQINQKKSYAFGGGFYINRQSGRIWAASRIRQKTKLDGSIIEVRNLISSPIGTRQNIAIEGVSDPDKWVNLSHRQARNFWQARYDQAPSETTERRHIFTGSILPIWSHLKGPDRILRLQTSDGDKLLGREGSDQSIDETPDLLSAKRQTQALTGATIQTRVMDEGRSIKLDNE